MYFILNGLANLEFDSKFANYLIQNHLPIKNNPSSIKHTYALEESVPSPQATVSLRNDLEVADAQVVVVLQAHVFHDGPPCPVERRLAE